MLHALIDISATAILRYQEFADPPAALPAAKGLRWLPVTDTRPAPAADETLEGPELAVAADGVTRTWRARPLNTAERLAAVRAARAAAYPAIGDQLDAAFKARAGDPAAQAAVDGQIAAVKAAHPKPAA